VTLQELISKLSDYWAAQGCLIQQPLDIQIGAGTMNPETFLRVLGPQPWSVAYVQPSRRPADGRFGENPNRLLKHHQFQVILKPAPDDVQDLYLQSLEACGIDLNNVERAPKFEFDRSDLVGQDRSVLDQIAKCVTTGPLRGRSLRLVGRADPRGEVEYNFALGEHRAGSAVRADPVDDPARGHVQRRDDERHRRAVLGSSRWKAA